MIKSFKDLLKRGNLPDDTRVVPSWMKIKNRQFDDVDVTNNSIDEIISLSSEEFNEFVSSVNTEEDKLVLPLEYQSIKSFANIVKVSKDNKNFEIYDLQTNEKISQVLKEKINLSKTELKDYLQLFDTPKSQYDLEKIGLWNAKVAVINIPSQYEDIVEDSGSGVIMWQYPVSADIYDMSVELPVTFKKKNGEYVSIGISPEYLILEPQDREKLNTIEKSLKF